MSPTLKAHPNLIVGPEILLIHYILIQFFWQIISIDNSKKNLQKLNFSFKQMYLFLFLSLCNGCMQSLSNEYQIYVHSLWIQSSWPSETKSSWLIQKYLISHPLNITNFLVFKKIFNLAWYAGVWGHNLIAGYVSNNLISDYLSGYIAPKHNFQNILLWLRYKGEVSINIKFQFPPGVVWEF